MGNGRDVGATATSSPEAQTSYERPAASPHPQRDQGALQHRTHRAGSGRRCAPLRAICSSADLQSPPNGAKQTTEICKEGRRGVDKVPKTWYTFEYETFGTFVPAGCWCGGDAGAQDDGVGTEFFTISCGAFLCTARADVVRRASSGAPRSAGSSSPASFMWASSPVPRLRAIRLSGADRFGRWEELDSPPDGREDRYSGGVWGLKPARPALVVHRKYTKESYPEEKSLVNR